MAASDDAAGARVEHESTPPAVPVVISCASTAYDTVSETATALRARGHEVEVVSGADGDEPRLAEAVMRFERQGLYVLCRSGTLDRAAVDRLRAVLRNNEVPFGRTLTLALEPGGARALEERIVSVARRMVTGRETSRPNPAAPPPPRTGGPLSRDELEDAQRRIREAKLRFPTGGQPVLQQAPIDEDDVDRWADSLAGVPRVDIEDPDMPTSIDDVSADGVAVDGLGAPQTAADAPSEALRPVARDEMTQPGAEMPTPDGASLPPSGVDVTQVTRAPMPPPPAPPPMAGPPPAAQPLGDEDLSELKSGSRTMMLVGIGVTSVLLVILVAFVVGGDDEEAAKADAKTAAKVDKAEPKADAKAKAEDDAKEAVDEKAEADEVDAKAEADEVDAKAEGDEVDEKAEVDAKAEVQPKPEPAPKPAPEPEPEPAPTPVVMREPAPDPQPDPGLAPGPATRLDSDLVLAALRERELRAWNTYIIADEETKPTTFARAGEYCKALQVGDLGGWRLPTIGELNSLASAKLVRTGVYWSTTPGDAYGDTQMVVNARKGSIAAVRADWDGGIGLCIRVRP